MVKKEIFRFVRQAVLRPVQTGAIVPSSMGLALQMIRDVPADRPSRVIEVGPGTGAITGPLITKMNDPSLYLGVEPNAEFLKTLRRKYPSQTFLLDTVQNALKELNEGHRPEHIVCSLPWALFPPSLQEEILASLSESLPSGGTFATFAYVHGRATPTGMAFRKLLESYFPGVEHSPVVWRNFPPALVYHSKKA